MRWKQRHTESGTIRIVTKFLLLPKALNGETRWLEKATWERKYYCFNGCKWRTDTRWLNN